MAHVPAVGGGENQTDTQEVPPAGAAEDHQERVGPGEGGQGRHRGEVQREVEGAHCTRTHHGSH